MNREGRVLANVRVSEITEGVQSAVAPLRFVLIWFMWDGQIK